MAEPRPEMECCCKSMFGQMKNTDVNFVFPVEGKVVQAHKTVLGARSPVFEAMFYSNLKESGDVEIVDFPSASFKNFLRCIYTGEFAEKDLGILLDTFSLINKYQIATLESKCRELVLGRIKGPVSEVFDILSYSLALLHDEHIEKQCIKALANAAKWKVLDGMVCLDKETLSHLVGKVKFSHMLPIELFSVLCKWSTRECQNNGLDVTTQNLKEQLGDLIYCIDYVRICYADLCQDVLLRDLLTEHEMIEILKAKANKNGGPEFLKLPGSKSVRPSSDDTSTVFYARNQNGRPITR